MTKIRSIQTDAELLAHLTKLGLLERMSRKTEAEILEESRVENEAGRRQMKEDVYISIGVDRGVASLLASDWVGALKDNAGVLTREQFQHIIKFNT